MSSLLQLRNATFRREECFITDDLRKPKEEGKAVHIGRRLLIILYWRSRTRISINGMPLRLIRIWNRCRGGTVDFFPKLHKWTGEGGTNFDFTWLWFRFSLGPVL